MLVSVTGGVGIKVSEVVIVVVVIIVVVVVVVVVVGGGGGDDILMLRSGGAPARCALTSTLRASLLRDGVTEANEFWEDDVAT